MDSYIDVSFTEAGYIIINPRDNCDDIVDAMLSMGYGKEFCLAVSFDSAFVGRLMEAGFLVMSTGFDRHGDEIEDESEADGEVRYILLPKLHLVRSALFFENLHVKKSIKRFLPRYELRYDTDFETIVNRCVDTHGSGWLTPPLVNCIKLLHKKRRQRTRPVSFGLYRDGVLAAGEFGVRCGGVYTSYSGYYDEDNSGTVQLVLLTRWLEQNGFLYFDLGMPLPYKYDLGAVDISPEEFVELFRAGRELK